jgi:cyclophilin family peptidyl-prolyl cis-trans isomerase
VLVLALFAVFAIISLIGGEDEEEPEADAVAPNGFVYGKGDCAPETRPDQPPASFDDAPRKCIEDDVDYSAVVTTSEGSFTMDLLEAEAPGAVNNFVTLADWAWFDGEGFHRVVPDFVDQAGNAAGRGNPGYTIPDELPDALTDYPKGTVAMANRGADTGGSQWFVCVDCTKLPGPQYTVFGYVTSGIEVVDAINALGTGDAPPSRPVTIEKVEIVTG